MSTTQQQTMVQVSHQSQTQAEAGNVSQVKTDYTQTTTAFSPMPGSTPDFTNQGMLNPLLFSPYQMGMMNVNGNLQHPLQVSPNLSQIPMVPGVPTFQRSSSTGSMTSMSSGGNGTGNPKCEGFVGSDVASPNFGQNAQLQMLQQNMYPQLLQNFVPMIQVQTAEGPQLQPFYGFYPGMNITTSPLMGGIGPNMLPQTNPMNNGLNVSMKTRSSSSKSFDGCGSEFSESTSDKQTPNFGLYPNASAIYTGPPGLQPKIPVQKNQQQINTNPAYVAVQNFRRRTSSDGYGSDGYSRRGSKQELYLNTDEVQSPVEGELTGSPEQGLMTAFDSLVLNNNKKSYNDRKQSLESNEKRDWHRSDKKRPTSKERQEELFKTELCNAWINGQRCRFGKRCMFAHGQHELRAPQRKLDRMRQRPPLRRQIQNILSKINEANSQSLTTELLCVCVEEIRDNEKDSMLIVKGIFKSACQAKKQHVYANMWQKLLSVHPMRKRMQRQMSELCLCEYGAPQTKATGLGSMVWIAELCRRNLFGEKIVYKILDDMYSEGVKEQQIEFWCELITKLKGCINTNKYFEQLSKFKKSFQGKRFMIMDLEDLRTRNWVPRDC